MLGGGGFVGANLVYRLLRKRSDVTAVVRRLPAWRLSGLDRRHLLEVDLTSAAELRQMVDAIRPRTVFDCAAYGAYSFETDTDLIYRTNFTALVTLAGLLSPNELARLRPCRQFVGIRHQRGGSAGDGSGAAEQPLRRVQGGGEPVHYIRGQDAPAADRELAAVLRLRPARRRVEADPEPGQPRARRRATRHSCRRRRRATSSMSTTFAMRSFGPPLG